MIPALVGRVSFTGDLGYEIWVRPEYQRALYDLLLEGGRGLRARRNSACARCFACGWRRASAPGSANIGRSMAPYEAGLGRFVDLKKNDFIGREAAAREKESGGKLRLQCFVVDALDADAIGDEPIWHDGKVIGWVTSGGYGHSVGKSLAMGYIEKELAGRQRRFRDRDHRRAPPRDKARRADLRSAGPADAGIGLGSRASRPPARRWTEERAETPAIPAHHPPS